MNHKSLIVLFLLVLSAMALLHQNAKDGTNHSGRFERSTAHPDLRSISAALALATQPLTARSASSVGLIWKQITSVAEIVGMATVQHNNDFETEATNKAWKSKLDAALIRTEKHQEAMTQMLATIHRMANQMLSRVRHLHEGAEDALIQNEQIVWELRKTGVKIATQMANLRQESNEAFQYLNVSMKDIQTMVQQTDKSLQKFRFETLDQFEMVREEMQENNDYLMENIEELLHQNSLASKENIKHAAQNISNKITELETAMNEGFESVNRSIFHSQGVILDHFDSIHKDLSDRLDRIDVHLEDISIQLNLFHDTFNARFDQLQQAIRNIELKLDQSDLNDFIDDMRALIGRWKEMMESKNDQDFEMARHKMEKFKELCEDGRHANPSTVLEWIVRNIYDQIRHPVTLVPPEYFVRWQKGVLALRNNAFLMYAACLATDEDKTKNLTDRLIIEKKIDLFDDNFLQEAGAVEQVHYAQWWRTYFKKSNLVFHFESGTTNEIERNLNLHEQWIDWTIGTQPNLYLFRVESPINDTVNLEQLVDQIHSKPSKPMVQPNDYLFCCLPHTNACTMRSESTFYHVCLGRSVWVHKNSDQSSLVINWWPKSLQHSFAQLDNFFVHHQGTGFAVSDTSELDGAWGTNKNLIEYMASEPGRFKRSTTWTWTVLLTDNICWWSQKNKSECGRNQCNWQNNTAITGSAIKIYTNVDNSKCCDLCSANKGCVAVSWYQAICTLYSSYRSTNQQHNWMAATKLKDCTQCTDTKIGCHRPSIINDYRVHDSTKVQQWNISSEQCHVECFKEKSRCVSYSWKLTDVSSSCQLHIDHGAIVREYGSFIILKPKPRTECELAKENACTKEPHGTLRCRPVYCRDAGDGVTYGCYCTESLQGQDCRLHRRCGSSSACLNGGICVDDPTMPMCVCPPGFLGKDCGHKEDHRITRHRDLCINRPCLFDGTCAPTRISSFGEEYSPDYKCECPRDYGGKHCEISFEGR